jgi:hypothetical protein
LVSKGNLTILNKKTKKIELLNGDFFSIYLDQHWFKVNLKRKEKQNNEKQIKKQKTETEGSDFEGYISDDGYIEGILFSNIIKSCRYSTNTTKI